MKKKASIWISLLLSFSFFGCAFPPVTSESKGAGTGSLENSSSIELEESSSINSTEQVDSDDLSIHFLQLGNRVSGDCTLIKVGDTEVLIDAGSTDGSAKTTVPYISQYCTDGKLEYVIATHGDSDHISSFVGDEGIFNSFDCGVIIDFAQTTKTTQVYKNYVALRDAEVAQGAQHYTALQCWNNADGAQRSYQLGDGVTLNILYQKYYEEKTSTENNYSVCTLISQGENHFLFTGDLEKSGEKSLVESNDLPKCKLYKAGHHGSKTSSTPELLSVIQPEIVVSCCCCGDKHGFPHQEFIDNVALYTDKVYVPVLSTEDSYALMNGNIVVTSGEDGITVKGSNNDLLLKDTAWFQANRTTPAQWSGE